MDKAHILHEIRRTAESNGGVPLGRSRFQAETGIRESDWIGKYWIKWNAAVREAGYEPNTKQRAFEDKWLLGKLAAFVRELGHFPVSAEIRMKAGQDKDFPSHNVFSRIGRKTQLASAVLTWCESNPGWSDVEAICAPLAEATTVEDRESTASAAAVEYGYVLPSKVGEVLQDWPQQFTRAPGVRTRYSATRAS